VGFFAIKIVRQSFLSFLLDFRVAFVLRLSKAFSGSTKQFEEQKFPQNCIFRKIVVEGQKCLQRTMIVSNNTLTPKTVSTDF
jgi:hypothetical protein